MSSRAAPYRCMASSGRLDLALVRAVGAVHREAERAVQLQRARVVGGARTASRWSTPRSAHASQPFDRERRDRGRCPARAGRRRSRRSRRARDRGPSRVVQLAPVEAGEAVGVEREEEERRVEPRLGHAPRERLLDPAALIGVVRERAVVDLEPGGFVAARARTSRTVMPAGHVGCSASGSGTRISKSSRAGYEAAAREHASSSLGCAPNTHSTRRPPPCAATCASARVEQQSRTVAVRRAPGATASPMVQCCGENVVAARDVRVRARRRATKPSGVGAGMRRDRARPLRRARRDPSRRGDGLVDRVSPVSMQVGEVARRHRDDGRGRACGEGTLGPWPVPEVPRPRADEVVAPAASELYPDARCALEHTNAYELLVATILSAQTHRRARQHGDARAVREVPDAGRPRARRPDRASRSSSGRPASSVRRRRASSGWRRRSRSATAARSRPSSTTS